MKRSLANRCVAIALVVLPLLLATTHASFRNALRPTRSCL